MLMEVMAGLFLALETFKSQLFEGESGKEVDTAWDRLQAESFAKIRISPVQIALTSANRVGYARCCKIMHSAVVARSSFTLMVGHRIHNGRSMISTN